MYKGYSKVRYEVGLAWGVKNIKPEHTASAVGLSLKLATSFGGWLFRSQKWKL
jgi:hypothetical protein